jgi:tRNA(Ile)-lysidine synthase
MLADKVKETTKNYKMVERGSSVLLCVSGGIDSMVLLDIFFSIKDELNLMLSVCHLNHNLRGAESERDQSFVESAALEKGLPFYTRTLAEGKLTGERGSLQERAREERYAFFKEAAEDSGASHIALAHNSDDQSETVLMRILKGASLKGLRGIPAMRGVYIRPLINASRAEIEDYASVHGTKSVEDSSNESTKYLRNKLRLELIPLLEKDYNPAIKETLSSLSERAERDYAFIEGEAAELFELARDLKSDSVADGLAFSRKLLADAPEALSTRVFLKAIEEAKGDTLDIYAVHVEAFLKLLASDDPGTSVDLPGGVKLRREYESVIFEAPMEETNKEGYDLELVMPGVTALGETGESIKAEIIEGTEVTREKKSTAFFDLDELNTPLQVRTFRAGDRMTPLGMEGTKKVQDIFVDDKVAKFKRACVPILVMGDDILWAAGVRQSDRAKVTSKTRKILKLTWLR